MNSHPNAFKSMIYRETREWDADFKIDIDTHRNPLRIRNVRAAAAWLTKRCYNITNVRVYRTGRGIHIRVWVEGGNVPPYTVLRVHGLFGDDPVRQRFNTRRVRRREPGWNVLWNEKVRNGKVVSQEVFDEQLTTKIERILKP